MLFEKVKRNLSRSYIKKSDYTNYGEHLKIKTTVLSFNKKIPLGSLISNEENN